MADSRREIDLACHDDPELSVAVEKLLAERASPVPASHVVGENIGHYRLISKIGEGGMGCVYLSRDLHLDRDVALKILPSGATLDPQARARLLREARIAAAINHPNIVTIHEVGTSGDIDYIVMEYVPGRTLATRIRQGDIQLIECLDVAIQTAHAVACAHSNGIIHRDLKPGNIIVTETGQVKVLDFGLATHCHPGHAAELPADDRTRTIEGTIAGTPAYMSPEQAQGRPVDSRSDIFSFGCVLYELITGHRAFTGDSQVAIMAAVIHTEPPGLRELAPGAPEELERIVQRALRKDPAGRWQTMADVLVALLQVRDPGASSPSPVRHHPRLPSSRSLPVKPTTLIGRTFELADIQLLLKRDDIRLVNLTGPGGIGKTRLAIEVCHHLATDFELVCFVELETLTDPAALPGAILRSVGIVDEDRRASLSSFIDLIGDKCALFVLDNFEQITEAARSLAELLSICPGLKILVTSRSLLHLRIEHEYPLGPLAVDRPGPLGAWQDIPAVALFVARARLSNLTDEVCRTIAEICARLDGLPLAIELAAARARILSPRMILARLEDRFDLLAGGAQDLPDRQRTLRRAIDWSYDLLNANEKSLLQFMAAFAGGFSVEAVEAISSDDIVGVFDALLSLSDKSLVRRREDENGDVRIWMLETVREYGLERLQESGRTALIRARHAAHYLGLVEGAAGRRAHQDSSSVYDALEVELGNCRVALDWLIETGQAAHALRISVALWPLWERRGHWTEGREQLNRVLSMPPGGHDALHAKALYGAGILADAQGDYAAARALFSEHLAAQRAKGDDLFGLATTINNLAVIAVREGDFETARNMYLESLEILRRLDCNLLITQVLNNLGNLAMAARKYADARGYYTQSIQISEDSGIARELAWTLTNLGNVAREEGNSVEAQELYARSLSIFTELKDELGLAGSMADLAVLACDRSEFFLAAQLYQESLVIFGRLGDKGGIARILDGFATIAAAHSRPAIALRLRGAAASVKNRLGVDAFKVQSRPTAGGLSSSIGVEADRAWAEGAAMSIEAAIEFALTSVADLIH